MSVDHAYHPIPGSIFILGAPPTIYWRCQPTNQKYSFTIVSKEQGKSKLHSNQKSYECLNLLEFKIQGLWQINKNIVIWSALDCFWFGTVLVGKEMKGTVWVSDYECFALVVVGVGIDVALSSFNRSYCEQHKQQKWLDLHSCWVLMRMETFPLFGQIWTFLRGNNKYRKYLFFEMNDIVVFSWPAIKCMAFYQVAFMLLAICSNIESTSL